MGAWGAKAFQNDSALDWLSELVADASGVTAARRALALAADTPPDDYLDVDDGSAAIAAAEIVAAALGRGRERVPKRALAWLDASPSSLDASDVPLAKRAVARVLATSSELASLWSEGGTDDTPWHADVRELLVRLGEG